MGTRINDIRRYTHTTTPHTPHTQGGDYALNEPGTRPSPFRVAPQLSNTDNEVGCFLVLRRSDLEVVCKHTTQAAACLCAQGVRCTKGRQFLNTQSHNPTPSHNGGY